MALTAVCKKTPVGKKEVLIDRDGGPSKIIINNKNTDLTKLQIYTVDGCLVKEGIRCDYLIFPNDTSAVFSELKGADVEHGIAQLEQSLSDLKNDVEGRQKYALLVATRCPLAQSDVLKEQTRFRRKLGCELRIRSKVLECSTTDFG
jgi:hypothetical protein